MLIENSKTAKYVSELMLNINGRLNESIETVAKECSPEEFAIYRRGVGKLINSIFEGILEPIYDKHPTLKPRELE
jgi:hypothetical protein